VTGGAIVKGGQRLAGLQVFSTDVNSLTLPVAQGPVLTEAFYWDQNDETRAWTKRFRLVRDMYLFQVKSPAESKSKDDI